MTPVLKKNSNNNMLGPREFAQVHTLHMDLIFPSYICIKRGLFSHSPPFSSRLSWICFMRDASPFLEQGRERKGGMKRWVISMYLLLLLYCAFKS